MRPLKNGNHWILTPLILGFILSGWNSRSLVGQSFLDIDSPGFTGRLHDNISNEKRQGSGFNPLALKSQSLENIFRDDAVGLNFEHIFNGGKEQQAISMFTPRRDECLLKSLDGNQYEIHWPAKGSKWGMDAWMIYDLSNENRIELTFKCTPTQDHYDQGFVAMMWASYMNRAIDRRIHFWGTDGNRTGWTTFGEGTGNDIEVGTVAHSDVDPLPFEEGAETLNLIEHPEKKFIYPFYYGLIGADHHLEKKEAALLYLVLFDQTDSIRFAMWNFFKNDSGLPDTHSPAWDWQYVIRNPMVDQQYGYRARIVIKPFKGEEQIWNEYRLWEAELGEKLPEPPIRQRDQPSEAANQTSK